MAYAPDNQFLSSFCSDPLMSRSFPHTCLAVSMNSRSFTKKEYSCPILLSVVGSLIHPINVSIEEDPVTVLRAVKQASAIWYVRKNDWTFSEQDRLWQSLLKNRRMPMHQYHQPFHRKTNSFFPSQRLDETFNLGILLF